MKAVFYTITDNKNVIGKALENGIEKNINIKKTTELLNPTISLLLNEYPTFNYCYLVQFNRYYFIDNVNVSPNGLYVINLKVDVLESFKNDILNSLCHIVQNESYNNLLNYEYDYQVNKEVDVYKSETKINYSDNIIMSTIGGL